MSEEGHDIQLLAAKIAAGVITYDFITDVYGSSMASSVAAFISSDVAEDVVESAYEVARDVPIVGDVLDVSAEFVGDVLGGFSDFF